MSTSRNPDEQTPEAKIDDIDEFDTTKLPPLPSVPLSTPTSREIIDVFNLLRSDPQKWEQIITAAENDSSDENFLYFQRVFELVDMLNDKHVSDKKIHAAFDKLWQCHIASDSSSFTHNPDEKPINISGNNRQQLTELFKMLNDHKKVDRAALKDGLLKSLQHKDDQRPIIDYMQNGRNGKITDPVMCSLMSDGLQEVRARNQAMKASEQKSATPETSQQNPALQNAIDLYKQYSDQNRASKQAREDAAQKFKNILIDEKVPNDIKVKACQFLREHHMFTRDAKLGTILKVTEQLLIKNGADYKPPKAGEKFFNKISAAAHDLIRGANKHVDKLRDKNPDNENKNTGMRRR